VKIYSSWVGVVKTPRMSTCIYDIISDAVLESVMVFRLASGAVAEVVVPLGLAKAGFLSGCTVVLGMVAAYIS
jgi:hypothetical protein